MRRLPILLLTVALVAAGCYGDDEGEAAHDCKPEQAEAEDPCFYRGRAILEGEEGSVLVQVEIAETDTQRSRGLMQRESLPDDEGMVFVFFEESAGGFWMKNTLIPLSIAFFDKDGTIVDILQMEPCEADPCPVYTPDSPYWGALEVNQGMFEEWKVTEGAKIEVIHNDRDRLFGLFSYKDSG